MNPFRYDFGYEWQYAYFHLIPLLLALAVFVWSWRGKRALSIRVASAVVVAWAVTGLLIAQFALRFNLPIELPTEKFLANGTGRVLDVGAGSGRAAMMVLLERPGAQVVALDVFKEGYGIGENTPERLYRNAAIAGVRERVTAQSGDMREMPFADSSFDAVVSSYAIDHVRRADSMRALNEVHRILRPGGEFLLEVMGMDAYVRVAYPFLGAHGFLGPTNAESRWRALLDAANFEVVESGRIPGTVFVLARKRVS